MSDLQELRRLAEAAAIETGPESDWYDSALIESDRPVASSRTARRFVAAMTPHMALRLITLADRVGFHSPGVGGSGGGKEAGADGVIVPAAPQHSGKYKAEPGRKCAACVTPNVCERDSVCFYPTSPDAGVKESGDGR